MVSICTCVQLPPNVRVTRNVLISFYSKHLMRCSTHGGVSSSHLQQRTQCSYTSKLYLKVQFAAVDGQRAAGGGRPSNAVASHWLQGVRCQLPHFLSLSVYLRDLSSPASSCTVITLLVFLYADIICLSHLSHMFIHIHFRYIFNALTREYHLSHYNFILYVFQGFMYVSSTCSWNK